MKNAEYVGILDDADRIHLWLPSRIEESGLHKTPWQSYGRRLFFLTQQNQIQQFSISWSGDIDC